MKRGPWVRWECVNPARNENKFYQVRWVWSLFPVIERAWGRIGATPRRLVRVYASPTEAVDELAGVVERRRERGYVLTAGADRLEVVLGFR